MITADNDGVNDVVYFAKNCNVPIDARIVNRWGNVVFETSDPSGGWDGNDKSGKPVAEGVYFYRVETEFTIYPDEEYN